MSDRHPLRPDLIDVDAYRREHHLDANNLPLSLSPDEKEAADHPGEKAEPVMADQTPAVSPTGQPLPHALTQIIFPILLAVLSAIAIGQPDILPNTAIDQQIATVLVGIIGWLSPGLRKAA